MTKRIVADSCCDLTDELQDKLNIKLAPFKMLLDGVTYIDDENLDPDDFLQKMKQSKDFPKSSCPSPHDFLTALNKTMADSIFVITLSSLISGSYNSALLAKNLFLENNKDKFIHVFDSKSATCGETLIALKIDEYIKQGLSNNEIIKNVTEFIENMKTFFILGSLDNMIKNGRISKLKATIANAFNVIPILKSTNGDIALHEKVRGTKKSFKRFIELIGEQGSNFEEKIMSIAHCNALEKAQEFKRQVMEKYNFKDVVIVKSKGLSTMYTDDGGIVIAF